MKQTTYFASHLFDGDTWLRNKLISVAMGRIQEITDGSQQQADIILDGRVAPGLIDTQVNGGGGVLLNHQPSIETLICMRNAHAKFGTTCMLPTVITDSYHVMASAADAMSEAIAVKQLGFLGIHFEGPHLSAPKRGIHPEDQIRGLSNQEFDLFCRQDIGKVVVTLAPETVPPEQIQALCNAGVIVSIGHSNATFMRTKTAVDAGATGFTHLYNAMSMSNAREPGVIGCALNTQETFAGIIVDHMHVHDLNAKMAIKLKTPEQMMLVTDAMNFADAPESELVFNGETILLEQGKLTTPSGTLAGSALDMMQAVVNTHHGLDLPLSTSLNMASSSPAAFLGMSDTLGKVKVGYSADFICFNDAYKITANVCKGQSLL